MDGAEACLDCWTKGGWLPCDCFGPIPANFSVHVGELIVEEGARSLSRSQGIWNAMVGESSGA